MKKPSFKVKQCPECCKRFIPASGAQKLCDDCRRARDAEKARPLSKRELTERVNRQKRTILGLQDTIEQLKRTRAIPSEVRVALAEKDAAIAQQRKLVGEYQAQAERYRVAFKAFVDACEPLTAALAIAQEACK